MQHAQANPGAREKMGNDRRSYHSLPRVYVTVAGAGLKNTLFMRMDSKSDKIGWKSECIEPPKTVHSGVILQKALFCVV